jgi:hypothetical protein
MIRLQVGQSQCLLVIHDSSTGGTISVPPFYQVYFIALKLVLIQGLHEGEILYTLALNNDEPLNQKGEITSGNGAIYIKMHVLMILV